MEYTAYFPSNGIILSYKPLRKAEALLVYKDIVIATGDNKTIKAISEKLNAKKIFLKGTILPGFVDAHMHIDSLGIKLLTLDLEETKSVQELIETIKNKKPVLGKWIIARGFDHNKFIDKKEVTRKDLDKITSDQPVFIIHRSGHMAVLNTVAMRKVLHEIPELKHELLDIDKGQVFEDNVWTIYRYITENLDYKDYVKAINAAQNHLIEHGITSIGLAGCSLKLLRILKKMNNEKLLKIRIYAYVLVEDNIDYSYIIREALNTYRKKSMLKVNGIKILLDGALGTHTAYLSKPYKDKETQGTLLFTPDKLREIITTANKYGLQVAIHAIGDGALDVILEIYMDLGKDVSNLRHRIEHASVVRDDQLEVIDKIKPVIVVQPRFLLSDTWIIKRIGYERIKWIYRFRSLYSKTIIGFSTDSPVEPVDPWETLYAAVTRGIDKNYEPGVLTSEEKMDLLSALDAYTKGSGYSLHEDRIGCLLPGCYADMVLVDIDPTRITNYKKLLEIRTKTIRIGEQAYLE